MFVFTAFDFRSVKHDQGFSLFLAIWLWLHHQKKAPKVFADAPNGNNTTLTRKWRRLNVWINAGASRRSKVNETLNLWNVIWKNVDLLWLWFTNQVNSNNRGIACNLAWISTFLQKNVLSIKEKSLCRTVKYKESCLISGGCLCTTVALQIQIWCVLSQVGRLILKISLWEIVAAQRQYRRHSASICHSFSDASAWIVYHDNTFLSAFYPAPVVTPSPHPCFLVEFMQFLREISQDFSPTSLQLWLK